MLISQWHNVCIRNEFLVRVKYFQIVVTVSVFVSLSRRTSPPKLFGNEK